MLLLSTWSFSQRGVEKAWPRLVDGASALDAAEIVCREAELDPTVDSVGFGGLPDRDGTMTLDGCVMLGPDRTGAVCAIREHLHPVAIARFVMERTPHVLLAGRGADEFATAHGFERAELLSDGARERWRRWCERPAVVDQSRDGALLRPVDDGDGGPLFGHDTVGVLAIDRSGTMAGACSTSGMAFKLPGRVGDSPIVGHGLYVDPEVGGATATGTGEIVMGECGSFLAVECMRRGASPREAVEEVLTRMHRRFTLAPHHQVGIIAVRRADESWSSGALRDGFRVSVARAAGIDLTAPDIVLDPDITIKE